MALTSTSNSGAPHLIPSERPESGLFQHSLQPQSFAASTERNKAWTCTQSSQHWYPGRCSNSMLVLQVTVMVYSKDLLSQGIFYRSACFRWETEEQILMLGQQHHILSTTCKKTALGHMGQQSIFHSERTVECAIKDKSQKQEKESCTVHCPVFSTENMPQGSNYCASLCSHPQQCENLWGSQQLGKQRPTDITALFNQPHSPPQGFGKWKQLGQVQTQTPQFIPSGWLQSKEGKGLCHSWTSCSAAQIPASPGPSQYQYSS